MQENGAEQVYRCTRTMLKIRSTLTDGEQKAQMREWSTEKQNVKSHVPAIPYGNRDCAIKNSQRYASSNSVQLPLPALDLLESDFSENREESQIAEPLCTDGTTLENAPDAPHAPRTCKSTRGTLESQPRSIVINFTSKDTIAPGLVDCQLKMLNFELYTYFIVLQTGLVQQYRNSNKICQILNILCNHNSH